MNHTAVIRQDFYGYVIERATHPPCRSGQESSTQSHSNFGLGGVELDLDADGVGDAGQVAGVAGDDGGVVADGGGDDDRVDDVGGAGGGAGDAGGAAGWFVVGEDVAALEDAGDLVLGAAGPGLGQHDGRDEGADAGGGGLVVQGEEVGVA